jgi:hypothetical protein
MGLTSCRLITIAGTIAHRRRGAQPASNRRSYLHEPGVAGLLGASPRLVKPKRVTHPPDQAVDDVVALLRSQAGRSPFDKVLTDLIGELSTRSETFRTRWARHDVPLHLTGTKAAAPPRRRRPRPAVRDHGTARRPGPRPAALHSRARLGDRTGLTFLASWTATQDQPTPASDGVR